MLYATKRMYLRLFGLLLIFSVATATQGVGQVLLSDDFNGSGFIDQTKWRLPFGGDGSFLGRTQLKTNLATGYPLQTGGVATLELETFLDDGSGGSAGVFLGHEINTKRNFARAGGLRIEGRMRMKDVPPGLVGSMFMYDVQRTNVGGDLVRDEFDHEMLTNEVQPGGQNRLLTNYWDEGPFVGPGSGGTGLLEEPAITGGWDMTQFHDYRIDWLPNRLDYYVDNQLVRTATENIPDDPMTMRFNLWAPDAGFTSAYSADLQPAANAAANEIYGMEIDNFSITRINTSVGENLLANESFEDISLSYEFPLPGGVNETDTGAWFFFNNTSFNSEVVRTGEQALKTFGPFSGGPNASGAWQNVDVEPGDVLEASVFAQSPLFDTLAGSANFATIKIEFIDESGSIMENVNTKESVIMDGRDPDFAADVWVEGVVNAIAPPNAAKARLLLPMIQLENEGGGIWWDDASLVKLTVDTTTVTGDFNNDTFFDCLDVDGLVGEIVAGTNVASFDMTGDGLVDDADLAAWLVAGGAANPTATGGNAFLPGDANLDGNVDGADFLVWNGSKFTANAAWCSGDFDASGNVDGGDFLIWNGNKFTSSDAVSAVPEPSSGLLLALAGLLWVVRRTRS